MTGDVTLELALDEYLHMLSRVAPWLLEDTEAVLRPFCHWLYARTAYDVPLSAADDSAVSAYAAAAAMEPVAAGTLRAMLAGLQRFAGQHLRAS